MTIRVSSRSEEDCTLHIVRVQRSSREQALAERTLRLDLDDDGTVEGVSTQSPASLFGFPPRCVQLYAAGQFHHYLCRVA